MADCAGLAADAATVDSHPDVDAALVAGGDERLAGERLVLAALEVLLDATIVDLEGPVAGPDDDPRHGALALAGRLDPGVGRHRDRPRRDRVVVLVGCRSRLAGAALLLLGLAGGPLLGGQLALLADRDRLEVGAGNDVLLRGLGGLGSRLLGGRLLLGGSGFRGLLGLGSGLIGLLLGGGRLRLLLGGGRLGLLIGSGLLGGGLLLGRGLVGRGFGLLVGGLGRLLVLALLALGVFAHLLTSRGFGCCAACGCAVPANTCSLRNICRPRIVFGSMPFTAYSIARSGCSWSIFPSAMVFRPPR